MSRIQLDFENGWAVEILSRSGYGETSYLFRAFNPAGEVTDSQAELTADQLVEETKKVKDHGSESRVRPD